MLYIVKFQYKDEPTSHEVKFNSQLIANNFHAMLLTNIYIGYINKSW